ncbi:uncharacterized protein LOC141608481 [Silene latifolia]|uniref:uncharacterized protein LOC141608481 n=1 Tax=Silene latifolia TaxID=37657 RepID=UPI003D77A80B
MAHMTKRDFDILDNNGTKYLQWRVDARANLKAKGLEHTILVDGNSTSQEQAKAIVFLRHHLHENLKIEYLFVEDPKELWDNLCQRLCGQATTDAAMIEKTLSTMHADNAARTVAPPETYVVKSGQPWRNFKKGNTTFHKGKGKWRPNFKPLNPKFKGKKKFTPNKGKPNQTTKCFKCGITGHWAKECRTAKHLVDLYTASQKGKGKEVETNFVKETSPVLSLDLSDYLIDDIDNGCGPST